MDKTKSKGLTLVVAGTVSLATVPVLSKILLKQIPPIHFTLLWMMCSLGYTLILGIITGIKDVYLKVRAEWKNIVFAGISATLWVILFFEGLSRIDPTVSSFLFNFRAIWGLLIGVMALKEYYRRMEWMGMGMIFGGSLLITSNVKGGGELFGMLIVVLSSLFFVMTSFFVKKFVKNTGIVPVLIARFLLPMIFLLFISLSKGMFWQYVNVENLPLLLFGSFLGPFFSFILIFSSLKYLGIGIQTVTQSSGPLFTGLWAFLLLGNLPPLRQFVGGIVIIGGVALLGFQSIKTKEFSSKT